MLLELMPKVQDINQTCPRRRKHGISELATLAAPNPLVS